MHGHTGLWLPAAPNTTAGQEALREVAERILDLGYDCVMDDTWPWSARLLRLFPDAKVIHTVRDSPEVWWRSWQKIVLTFLPTAASRPYCWLVSWDFIQTAVRDMFGVFAWDAKNLDIAHPLPWVDIPTLKPGVLQDMKDQFISAYKMQEALMRAVTPPDKLLVFNVRQGWDPLCSFLQVAEHCPGGPLPHLNQGAPFDLIQRILLAVCYAYPLLPLVPLLIAVGIFKFLRAACRFLSVSSPAGARDKQD